MGVDLPDAQHIEDAHPLPWIARRKCGSKSSRRLLRGARNCCQAVFVHPARLRPPEPCLCRTSKSPAGNSTQHQNRAKLILGRTPRRLGLKAIVRRFYSATVLLSHYLLGNAARYSKAPHSERIGPAVGQSKAASSISDEAMRLSSSRSAVRRILADANLIGLSRAPLWTALSNGDHT